MANDPVQLFNDGDPRGNRYNAEDRERAYGDWYVTQNLTKTAKSNGIALNTLRAWHKEDGWAKRAQDDRDAAVDAAKWRMSRLATDEVEKNFETIKGLRDDTTQPGKVRMDAAVYINGVLGIVVPKTGTLTVNSGIGSDGADDELPDFEGMSMEQLRDWREKAKRRSRRQVA